MFDLDLVEVFSSFKGDKNTDHRATMVRVLEDVFRSLLKKRFDTDENFSIIVNPNKGDLEIWRVREVTADGEVTDENAQISLSEARELDPSLNIGEECYEQLSIEGFGRRAIMAARQTLVSRIAELEKEEIYRKFVDRVGDIVTVEVHQIMKKELLVLDDASGVEMVLPRAEMIKQDYYRKGDLLKAIIKKVEMRNSAPYIMLSRTDPEFLIKLMEAEVPEIEDGIIAIKKAVRMPGERAKVAVESYDERIDPVGACVGMKGSRIHGIVRELCNENIDIIPFTNNIALFIQRSITPAKPTEIEVDETRRRASVYLAPDQVSLAIGKGGANIKLASKLTDYEIDVYRNDPQVIEIDDVDLEEFSDVFEPWVIEALKGIGCDTARQVLELSAEELMRRTDLEEVTVNEVLRVLSEEFDD